MARYDTYGAADDQILEDSDTTFKGFNNRSRPDALEPGMFTVAENIRFSLSGVAEKRKSVDILSAPFVVDDTTSLTLPFQLKAPVDYVPRDATVGTGALLALELSGGGSVGSYVQGYVYGLTVIADPNGFFDDLVTGNYELTSVTPNALTFTLPSEFEGVLTAGTEFRVSGPILSNAQNTRVVGSNNFVDPNNNDDEYILLASTANAVAVNISTGNPTTINYPTGRAIDEDTVTVLQAFDRVYIFEEGHVPMSWDMDFFNAFVEEESGEFTQPTLKSGTADITNGLVELTDITNTGFGALVTGDEIVIIDGHNTGLTDGDVYQVANSTETSVSFYAEADTVTNDSLDVIGRVSGGAGFIHAPAPGDAIVHRNRLVVPYKYTVNTGEDSYTERGVTDELLISFPFNSEKFDTTYGTFVTAGGQNDSFVAAFSFAEDKLLMFNRKSISVVTGVDSFNFQEARVQSLTKEIGLVAKDSIVQVGNQIMFLSDNGVYGVSFQDLYNLRGNDIPLSEAIDNSIQGLDKNSWQNSSAVYFDNRYYIAVPSIAGGGINDTVLVFNFLNGAWESVDTYLDLFFSISKLIVAGTGDKRGVYAVNSQGGVHQLEASTVTDTDRTVSKIGSEPTVNNISTTLKTRQYNLGTIDRKKWNNYEIVAGSLNGNEANINVEIITENIDKSGISKAFNSITDEGVSNRARIGNVRAYGAQANITNQIGRMRLSQFKIAGALTFRSQNKAE